MSKDETEESVVREIRRKTRKKYFAEEKIVITEDHGLTASCSERAQGACNLCAVKNLS